MFDFHPIKGFLEIWRENRATAILILVVGILSWANVILILLGKVQ